MARRRGHGEGAIYQRADGLWCASVDLGIVNGKRRRKVVYGKTRKEVADKLKALHHDQADGINTAPDQQTVAQFLDRWLRDVVARRNKPRTHESYSEMVRLHIVPYIGHQRLQKLLPEHVLALMNALSEKGLSPRTVQYARTILVQALNQAVKWGHVPRNVATLVDAPRVEQHKIEPLTLQQTQALLLAVKGRRLEALYRIALSLGLRRGEVLALWWENIDFEARTLRVEATLQRVRGELVRSMPKTRSGKRLLPLPATLVKALQAHRDKQQGDSPYVFTSTHGTPIEPRNLIREFKAILKQAGLPETTRFHDLRHSCATFLIAQGVHPRVIMEILGHAQISTTMNIYGHVLPDTHREATDKLDDLLGDDEE